MRSTGETRGSRAVWRDVIRRLRRAVQVDARGTSRRWIDVYYVNKGSYCVPTSLHVCSQVSISIQLQWARANRCCPSLLTMKHNSALSYGHTCTHRERSKKAETFYLCSSAGISIFFTRLISSLAVSRRCTRWNFFRSLRTR